MAQELRFTLDGSVYDGVNAENFSITVAEEPTLGYRYVSYDNDLQFTGAAYAYLNGLITGSCGCDLVEVRVDYKCGGTFTMLCTGYIILAECNADLDRCQITTKLYDNTFSTLINNNKAIPFSTGSELTKNQQPIVPPTMFVIDLFVPATGVYDTTNFAYGVRVEDAFIHLVGCMTDNRVDVSAPVFASGDYEWLMLLNGRQILAPQQQVPTLITFEQLFVSLRNKLNISLSTTIQANGRPLLTIDYADNINALPVNANLVDVSGVRRKQDTAQLYSTVGLGNREMLEQWQCNNGDTACTFAQTPFFGFREESFGLIGNCNRDTELDLVVNDVVFDTNVIEDIFVWGNQSYELNPIIIICENTVIPAIKQAKQFDPYGIGQTVYNGDFTNRMSSQNWINGIPSSIYFYNSDYDWNCSITTVRNNKISPVWQSFVSVFGQYLSFLQTTGDFFLMEDVVSDPCNNWVNNNEYRVPRAGHYTINLQVVVSSNLIVRDFAIYAAVEHYNSNDEIINVYDWTNSTGGIVSGTLLLTANRTCDFIANQGDYIRANVYAQCLTAGVELELYIAGGSGDNRTEMFIQGQPIFEDNDLLPVDPCDYKRYLYDFEYPLTMSDIANIVQQPSAPIRFSRTPTINAGISGTINKMTVQSVVKQMADFTIRSKDIL